MIRNTDKLALFVLLLLGSWGCGRGPTAADQRAKQNEAKIASLQADLDAATAKVSETEQTLAREQARLRSILKERESLAARLQSTLTQRDFSQQQFEALVKKIEGVLGESKAAMAKPEAGTQAVNESAKVNSTGKDGL